MNSPSKKKNNLKATAYVSVFGYKSKIYFNLKKLKKYFMQDFLDVAEAVTEHLSIQLDNPSIGLDEQVYLSVNKVI